MADKKIILEVELLEGDAQSKLNVLNASLKNLDKTHKDYKPTLELIKKAERELSKIQEKRILVENRLASSTGKVDKATNKTAKQMKQLSSDTGASTAATLELGRVFSDAPYGIRGVANNIQQLASNLFFMSKKTNEATGKTVGFGGAIGSLLKNLIGPAGILVAFQAGVALLDYFKVGMSEAKDAAKDLNEELKKEIEILEGLSSVSDNVNSSIDDRNNAIITAIASNKEYSKSILNGSKTLFGQEESLRALLEEKKKQLELDKELIKVSSINDGVLKKEKRSRDEITESINKTELALLSLNGATSTSAAFRAASYNDILKKEKEILKALDDRAEAMERINELYEPPREVIEGSVEWYKLQISNAVKFRDQLSTTSKAWVNQTEIIKRLTIEMEKITGKDGGKKSTIKLLDVKEFEGDLFEVEDMLRKFSGKELLRNAKTEEEKNTAKAIIELEGFKKSFQDFRLSEDEKLVEFKEALEKKRLAEIASAKGNKKRISEINAIFDKTSLDAQETYELESTISYNNYITGLKAIVDKNKPDLILGELGRTQLDRDKATEAAQEKHLTFRLDNFAEYADTAKQAISSMTDFINGEYDRELIIEQNKTNSLNTELNNRLLNENLSKEQRRKIQNEIAQNDEKLRVKQEIIERKRFKMNKAANIANALMDTASAAAGVMAQAKGGFFARLAQAIPTIAFGLAQVATIARQKFQSSASKTPISTTGGGGSGGGSERAEPSFNIVGRSDDNLLINAIQATFDKPLKAYVVARDVTNQQQLDGIITDKAGT